MSQKDNKVFYVVAIIIASLGIYFQNAYMILVLLVFSMGSWFMRDYKIKLELKDAKQALHTKRKEADGLVEDASSKLTQLIDAIPSPLVYINQRGDFEVINVYFKQMIEVMPDNVYDVSIDSPLRQIMLDAFLNEKQFIRQFSYHGQDFQVHSIPIINDNRYTGCMLIFQDVTRVTEGEKMQKRFIADASHELRTPIASIKGMAEILNRPGFNDPETLKEFLEQIEKETGRLDLIVKDLLLQSRLKANKVYLEKSVFNLRQFFDGLVYERRQELHQANIKVKINCPSDITVFADQFRLSQVYLNLINNSINYAKNGTIEIDCSKKRDEVTISFSDDGKGIKKELLPHIFDRFYRGESDRNREQGGSGLGLAISKSIIEAHNGSLEVDSIYGKGTTFITKLTQI
ncbi:cell wall metabolism sensor histidine kinase WalK [Erysipelothrix urinaevulpis]|uniref:sensor histidine kinase n=1 Tax=Erysipelothrix urinaevulpis TaxID=2683717 RepID=UPI0013571F14|nr:ATP-binding protein [Erysipelothrix urinaevulpis]